MAGLKRLLTRLLVVLGAAALVWAGIGLFWPVKSTLLSGTLDSGRAYTTTYATYAYNALAGWLIFLAAAVCAAVSVRLFQGAYGALRAWLWAVFAAIMLAATAVVGGTTVISWLSGVPAEIQHGIGSPYVKVTETLTANVPLLVAQGFIMAFIAAMTVYAALAWYQNRDR